MFHYVNAITNTKGDALVGYYVKAIDKTTGSVVPIYADESSTPIISVSGVANAAQVDGDGNASFYTASGEYHLNIYAADGTTFVKQIPNIPMVNQDDIVTNAALAASTGAAAVGKAGGGTVQDAVNRIGTFAGYDTGNGGTVTQATSKSTAVTINKPCGKIVLNAASLASGAIVSFDVNNSFVGADDVVTLNARGGSFASGQSYEYRVDYTQAGLFRVFLKNISGGSLAEAMALNFAVIKGASA